MVRKTVKRSPRGALVKGMTKNLPSEVLTDPVFKSALQKLLRGYAGIYALYKDDNLYYIGLARSLHGRIHWHLKDRHAGRWNNFKVFLIQRVRYLKDIETLMLQVAAPKGNRVKGNLPKGNDLNNVLRGVLRDHQRKIKAIKRALR